MKQQMLSIIDQEEISKVTPFLSLLSVIGAPITGADAMQQGCLCVLVALTLCDVTPSRHRYYSAGRLLLHVRHQTLEITVIIDGS